MRTALVTIAAIALTLLALTEAVFGFPVAWWLYALVVIAFAFGLVRPLPVRQQIRRLCVLAAVIVFVVMLYFVDWSTRKPFLRDLARVHVGMTEADVRRIMGSYIEGTGLVDPPGVAPSSGVTDLGSGHTYRTAPSPNGEVRLSDTLVFRHSTESAFNADWGIIKFSDGKVTGVDFSPD
jgi:hypothetical protein